MNALPSASITAERSNAANILSGFLMGRMVGVHMFSLNAELAIFTCEGVLSLLDGAEEVDVLVGEH